MSRLAWGVWVEICISASVIVYLSRHASHEACELKSSYLLQHSAISACHASHEACELKSRGLNDTSSPSLSRLAWGVWVEIAKSNAVLSYWKSRLAWGVWVEIFCYLSVPTFCTSRLAWGVWVEICRSGGMGYRPKCHASHEACELKWIYDIFYYFYNRHASHEACELKWCWNDQAGQSTESHASHEACELKFTNVNFLNFLVEVTPRMRRVSWN